MHGDRDIAVGEHTVIDPPHHLGFTWGWEGDDLWLAGPESSAQRPMPNGAQPEAGGWNRLVIQVDDIAATVEALFDDGAKLRNEIVPGPGGQQILVEDPSGNCIEIFQPDAD